MENRQAQLSELRSYIARVEKETTLALQTLRWDPRRLREDVSEAPPAADRAKSSRMAAGYSDTELLLPDANVGFGTVTLSMDDISQIIRAAASNDPLFERGSVDAEALETPQSDDRLRSTFTRDERRVIYDYVAASAPKHDIDDIAIPGGEDAKTKVKSKLQVLAELRDMKRRRAKYKVATKSKNYSEVLREVIRNQMELYTGVQEENKEHVLHKSSVTSSMPEHAIVEIKKERQSLAGDNHRQEINHREDREKSHRHTESKRPGHRSIGDHCHEDERNRRRYSERELDEYTRNKHCSRREREEPDRHVEMRKGSEHRINRHSSRDWKSGRDYVRHRESSRDERKFKDKKHSRR